MRRSTRSAPSPRAHGLNDPLHKPGAGARLHEEMPEFHGDHGDLFERRALGGF